MERFCSKIPIIGYITKTFVMKLEDLPDEALLAIGYDESTDDVELVWDADNVQEVIECIALLMRGSEDFRWMMFTAAMIAEADAKADEARGDWKGFLGKFGIDDSELLN